MALRGSPRPSRTTLLFANRLAPFLDFASFAERVLPRIADDSDQHVTRERAGVTWDLRDKAGRRVRPGIYFLRVRAGEVSRTVRLLVAPPPDIPRAAALSSSAAGHRPGHGKGGGLRRDILNIAALVAGVLVLAVGGPVIVRQLRSLPQAPLAARAGERIVTLEVSGMSCAGCASSVEARLVAVPGVSTVAVRYPQRRAYVVCLPSVAETTLVATVARVGPGFSAAVTSR